MGERFALYASHVKEGEIRKGWYCTSRTSAEREGKEHANVLRYARGDA